MGMKKLGGKNVVQIEDLKSVKSMFDLTGKAAIITGAAGGIGRSGACALAELGANVALFDLKEETVQRYAAFIAEKYDVKTLALKVDVSDESSVKEAVKKVYDEFGRLDILHSNAGIILPSDTSDMPYEEWKKMMDIDLNSMFLMDQVASEYMKKSGGGSIINTASMSSHVVNKASETQPNPVCYCAAKGGVRLLTKAMASSLSFHNIRVNSISPGVMYSGIHDYMVPDEYLEAAARETVPLKHFGSMDEISGVIAFLASDLSAYMTGTDVLVDGGYTVW